MKLTVDANGGARKPKKIPSRKSARGKGADLNTILVPTDFSRPSQQAIPWAKFIAHQSHGKIHLVHVHDFEYAIPGEVALELMFQADVEKSLRRDLYRVAAKHDLPNPKTSCHIRSGRAFDQVEKLADEIHADLIVTSTHGYTGLKHVLLGSTAERIVRHSTRPVFVARRAKTGRMRAPRLKKIVVPLDFSKRSEIGLHYAVELARCFGAKLFLVHVVRLDYLMADGYAMYAAEEILKVAHEAAEEKMRRVVAATDFGKVEFQTSIETGSPENRVCSYAQERSADVIVTSTHGRTGFQHVLIGSTAEHIVRYAECPVLVVPARRC